MTAKVRLKSDRAELARFVDATFRYADDGTDAVLRTFAEGSNEVLGSVRVPLNGAGLDPIIEHAAHQATKAANAARPAVFAPPVATFIGCRTRECDLGNGLVLTVEADQAPAIARRNLQFVLGPPTVVVASGGHWTDPESGEVENKLHLHWRCKDSSQHDPVLDDHDLAALGEIIANPDREWADWNRLGMAFFAASNGAEAGLAAFDQVSQRSAKYDASDTQRRWEHFHQSPPHRLGPGTLIYEARQIDPAFRLRSRQDRRPGGDSGTPNAGAADQVAAGPDEQACEWRTRLLRNDKGSARDCVANAVLILRSDTRFLGRLRLDELHQATFTRDLPWDRSSTWRPWSDVDDIEIAHWCQLRGVILKPPTCAAAVQMVASHHRHHAVRGYLENLRWDGMSRLDVWLETYLGAQIDAEALDASLSDDDLNCEELTPSEKYTAYLRSIGPKWLIAAVARIYRPGCKVDHVIVFEGPQGVGKSTCLRILAGDDWFADEISDLGTKDSAQDLRGKWVVELAEVAALKRATLERMKAFISRNVDHYRPSYGRRSMDFPRQCVFAGTTNADAYLADETGNRRFWPVKVTGLRLEELLRDRDQLWAEAVVRFKAGEIWWLDREVEAFAAEEQEQRRQGDPWEEAILDWLPRQNKTEHTIADLLRGALQREVTDGKIRMVSGTSVITRSADDGSLIASQSGFTGTSGIVRFDARTGALYTPTSGSGIEQWLPGRSSDDSAVLGDVVAALCERVGLTAADLDVSELTDEVHGFGIARQISVRGALEMLAATYAFDAVESDHQLKFKKRGRPPSRVIPERDLVPVNPEREAFIETRAQEVDLPARFTVVYQDLERDADVGTQYAKRVAGPSSAMHSQNVATFDLPLMLTAAEAKGIALRQLHSAWLERTGYEWRLPWTHVDLEPADVVQVALHDGTLLNVRLVETELGANLELAWKTVLEESSSYTVTAVPGGGLNYLPQVDPVSSEARLFLLDTPLIRDSDDALRAASGHYWAAGAYLDPPWRGAVLFASDDGAVYVAADETLAAVTWGVARTALPDTALPFQTDTTSQLQVTMVSGSLAPVSNLAMLNGANLAALIRADGNAELIQFQDVALSEGVYTITTLLRGRRGTEVFTAGHAAGDLFVLLDGEGVTRRPLGLDRIGDTLHYRAVGRGGELRDARTGQLTLAGNDLKPYAPVHLAASGTWGSDVTLSWQRRTRVGGELIDGTGEVPLAEDAEEYELEILFGDLIVRTETGLTPGSYVYTSAAQASDFPGYIDLQRLVNPSFEEGDLSGWTVESGGTFVADTAHESLSGGHGDAWFLRSSGDGTLAQTVDVSALAQQIDLGLASARARCWVAETASDDDTANIRLQFLDANDIELDTVDPVAIDPTGTTFVQIEAEGAIPVGTRKIKVRLTFDQVSGVSPNVAMDDVTLEVDPGTLGFLDIAVYQVSAQVGRGFRAAATLEV